MNIKITIEENGITTVKEFTELDSLALANDLLSENNTPMTDWLFPPQGRGGPVYHKIYQCKRRMVDGNIKNYFADPSVNTDEEIILAVTNDPGYKNRNQREIKS